jgi:hypothetical protein
MENPLSALGTEPRSSSSLNYPSSFCKGSYIKIEYKRIQRYIPGNKSFLSPNSQDPCEEDRNTLLDVVIQDKNMRCSRTDRKGPYFTSYVEQDSNFLDSVHFLSGSECRRIIECTISCF